MSVNENPPSTLLHALRDLVTWFASENIAGVIIGGVAVSILARPRVTRDIDAVVLVDENVWDEFLRGSLHYGFQPRIEHPLEFAHQSRVLLLRHKSSEIDIDISFGVLPFESELIDRSHIHVISGINIPLPTAEDLIILKAIAHRSRDLIDIDSILDVHRNLDLKRVFNWVKEFAIVLEMPEIEEDLKALIEKKEKSRKSKSEKTKKR